jgi:TetR/AcrR family transcriptional regulator, transcriptional repressor of bet genes
MWQWQFRGQPVNNAEPSPPRTPRTLSKDARRVQIIEATIATLAKRGFSRTTVTDVARRAGLSHGLLLFHFESKDRLLAETLDFLSDEYRMNWQSALATAGDAPENQLAALVRADFTGNVCRPDRLGAWVAFWGESQSLPLYQTRCGANDDAYIAELESICARMNGEHGYGHDAVKAARIIRVLTEGTWIDLMTLARPYGSTEALATVWACAANLYPRHFGPEGLMQGRG